jgi:hypothetical protein
LFAGEPNNGRSEALFPVEGKAERDYAFLEKSVMKLLPKGVSSRV